MLEQVTRHIGERYLAKVFSDGQLDQSATQRAQEKNFQYLKRKLKGTKIYEDLKLNLIFSYNEFVKHVPVKDYTFYKPYVDEVLEGKPNILFKDKIEYIGLTSGTSGQNSKKIPYNEKMISCFLSAQRRVASVINVNEVDVDIISADRLAFGSSPVCYEENSLKHGYISGILSSRAPRLLKKHCYPSEETLNIPDWDSKINEVMKETLDKDIQVVSGIPTYIISVFEAILEKTGARQICEIWPNMKVFIYAATPIKQYESRINELVGRQLSYYGLYASTEAPIGIPSSKFKNGAQSYTLNPDLLYTFAPVDDDKENLGVQDLKTDNTYYVNIGCHNGFVHYAMKDIIKIQQTEGQILFDIIGRKNTGINVAAEKVSDENLLNTVFQTKKDTNTDIRHFFVAPNTSGTKANYQWSLFVPNPSDKLAEQLSKALDLALCNINLDYKDCRDDGVIDAATVVLHKPEVLNPYFEANRSKGQFKPKTSFLSEEEFNSFWALNFEAKRPHGELLQ